MTRRRPGAGTANGPKTSTGYGATRRTGAWTMTSTRPRSSGRPRDVRGHRLGQGRGITGPERHLPVVRPSLPPEVREGQRLALGTPRPRRLRPVGRADDRMASGWQLAVPPDRREVVMGPTVPTCDRLGRRSRDPALSISPDVITAREEFYGQRMAWIFDATRADITVRPSGSSGKVQFRWKSPRWSAGACRKLMLLDLGGGWVLRVPRWASLTGGPGVLYTRASVEGWLQDGTRWERIIMPAS